MELPNCTGFIGARDISSRQAVCGRSVQNPVSDSWKGLPDDPQGSRQMANSAMAVTLSVLVLGLGVCTETERGFPPTLPLGTAIFFEVSTFMLAVRQDKSWSLGS